MQIDFVKKEFTEEDGKLGERYWDMIEEAAGAKETDAKDSEITELFVAALTPDKLKGSEYCDLPEEIRQAVSKLEGLTGDLVDLARRNGFNAGYAAGLAEGVLLGKYNCKAG